MDNLTAHVSIKCRVAGKDPENPQKDLSQRIKEYKLKTQIISMEEWMMRQVFAYMILKYGLEMEDWDFDWDFD